MSYAFLDSGFGRKLERFGPYTFIRPAQQAIWSPSLPEEEWAKASGEFIRLPQAEWLLKEKVEESWICSLGDIRLKLSLTDFGHVGMFPEHAFLWPWMEKKLRERKRPADVLNLFGYSGAATLFAVRRAARVCHLDASKAMVQRARENASINGAEDLPIRWIVEDVTKFLKREIQRGRRYDAVILDPPSFGRGAKGEVFKIEKHVHPLLQMIDELLSDDPLFVAFTSHTSSMTPLCIQNILREVWASGELTTGELSVTSHKGSFLPGGTYGTLDLG